MRIFAPYFVIPPHGRVLPVLTSAAALPGAGAALRVVRGVAGRRLVQVALLVGGLFVLGVLCGERANAAEGAPTSRPFSAAVTDVTGTVGHAVPSVGEHVVEPVAEHAVEPATEQVVRPVIEDVVGPVIEDVVGSVTEPVLRPVTNDVVQPVTEQVVRPVIEDVVGPVTEPVLRPVTNDVVQPVTEQVVRPVIEDVVGPVTEPVLRPVTNDVVQPVTEQVVRPVIEDVVRPVTEPVLRPVTEHVVGPVGDLVGSVTEGLAEVPTQFPPVSGMPSLPGVPGLPELPGLPGWTTLPVETLPVDVTPQEPGRTETETPGSTGDGDRDGERAAGSASVVYGPHAADGATVVVSAPHRAAGAGDSPVVRVPAQQNPDGLPTGTLGRHSAVDNGGPRHAEPHAVASLDRAPLSLVPGATAADAADGTRDRHRDIPEFPG
ncbi:hypothetical protein [Streptomyces sp. DSM 40750]|uniref:hypothetical protein n=1 Tax=Streptomyces sp. DSM 40750 TaxID=2801030 RepID=UPI00214CC0FC|nr:hypothetical protein [Streptomyces sp. DSM 40750]UUU24474.1 hypothetical protein JIX55_31805 [Streptomyces sp. DSM 40750]